MRLIRSTAWCLRFIKKSRKRPTPTDELLPEELEKAEHLWIKTVQQQYFQEEIQCLKMKKEIPKLSKLNPLTPVLDDNGILRVMSRIQRAELEINVKMPIILETQRSLTRLLILWHHKRIDHHGQELLVNELRQKYYIYNLRAAVKRSWSECQYCKNYRAKPHPP
ncbi:unnamed protein product, partial [Allacma fusca]